MFPRVKIPITKIPIKIQFEINACLLFSFANIFDKNMRPKLLGINVKLIICTSVENSVYSGNIISTIVGVTKAPNMARKIVIYNSG